MRHLPGPGVVIGAAIAVVLATGCKTAPSDGGDGGDLLSAAGGDGVVVVAVWPARWSAGLDQLRSAVAAAVPAMNQPELARAIDQARQEVPTAWSAVRWASGRAGFPELPATLPGIDESRPLVWSGFAPIATAEELAASIAGALAGKGSMVPSGSHHRLVIPASDPAQVAAALTAAIAADGSLKPLAGVYGDDERLVRVSQSGAWVTADVVVGRGLGGLDERGRRRALDGQPGSPHPLFSHGDPSVARLHVRVDRLAGLGSSMGMSMVARSVVAAGGRVDQEVMQGYSEVLAAPLVMDPAGALVTDGILDVPASAPSSPVLYLVATGAGVTALGADQRLASGAPTSVDQLDVAALSRAATAPPIFDAAKSASDVAEVFHECGSSCLIYGALGNGLSLLKVIEAREPGTIARLRPAVASAGVFPAARLTLAGSVLLVEPLGRSAGAVDRARSVGPGRAPPRSAAAACYSKVLLELRGHLHLAATEETGARAILDRFLATARGDLDCAGADQALAVRVAQIRETIADLRALAPP